MYKHVTIDNIMDWIVLGVPSMSNSLILEELADKIADLLNGTYTIAQLRNAILNDKTEPRGWTGLLTWRERPDSVIEVETT
jgi:hypothetical protein